MDDDAARPGHGANVDLVSEGHVAAVATIAAGKAPLILTFSPAYGRDMPFYLGQNNPWWSPS